MAGAPLRSIWSAETLVGGMAGIHNQIGLLLTKVEGDEDLKDELGVSWRNYIGVEIVSWVCVLSPSC